MMFDKKLENYIDHKVYGVTKIKNVYGFRVELIYADGSTAIQQKSGFSKKSEASKFRDQIVGELHAGKYVVYGNIKVKDFLVHWVEDVARPSYTDDTYRTYRNAIYNHIIPELGNMQMEDVKRVNVSKLYKEKYLYSPNVARMIKTVMKSSMRYAVKKRAVRTNPAEGVELPRKRKKTKTGYRTRKIDIDKTLTLDQMLLLLEKSKDSRIYMQVLFSMLLGLRRGEMNGVKYSDVDYINRTITIKRQLGIVPNTKREEYDPKTYTKQEIRLKTDSSERVIPLPDIVFEAILEQRKIYEANRSRRPSTFIDDDYICCSSYGRPRSKSYHAVQYKNLLRENGLPDIRWHDLRRTFTTLLLKNDFSPKAVSRLLGHAKEIITIDIYGNNAEIIRDGVSDIQPFIDEVIPQNVTDGAEDLSGIEINVSAYF